MPLQNRADPTGKLHANASRGLFTGNRGVIHDPATNRLTGRGWTTTAWIICDCGFQNRKREVFGRNARKGRVLTGGAGWTNIFFLDEVTALAAGHRPCFECRRDKAKEFADCFGKAFGIARPKAAEIDARLHAERWLSGARENTKIDTSTAPDGTFFQSGGGFVVKRDGKLLAWSFDGYSETAASSLAGPPLALITPSVTIAILAAGYQPVWHAGAG